MNLDNAASWRSALKNPKTIVVVLFYNSASPTHASDSRAFAEAAKILDGYSVLAGVDCSAAAGLCRRELDSVRGLRSKSVVKLYPYKAHARPIPYKAAILNRVGLYRFVQKHMPSFVTKISTRAGLKRFLASRKPKVLLVSAKPGVSMMYASLSKDFAAHFEFAQLSAGSRALMKELRANLAVDPPVAGAAPTLYLHVPRSQTTRRYRGAVKHSEIRRYLKNVARKLA